MNKPKCDLCPATYLSRYSDNYGGTRHRCLAHLPNDIDTDFDRYEHLILNEVKKSLPSQDYYEMSRIIPPKFDKTLIKGVKQRPDLIIRSPLEGKSIVIVEVDEGYHNKEEQRRLDKEREEYFRIKLTEDYEDLGRPAPSVSFVRIEPFDLEENSIVGKMAKTTISPGKNSKKVIKKGEFEGVLKTSISEIRKKLTRRSRGTQTIKITPDNYRTSYSSSRSPLKSPYSKFFPRRRSTLEAVDTRRVIFDKKSSHYSYTGYHDSSAPDGVIDISWDRKSPTSASMSILKSRAIKSSNNVFTKEQKSKLSKLLKSGTDYTEYVGSIYGRNFKKSRIKLSILDPIPIHLHVIQGSALGFSDKELLKGVEKLRKISSTIKMPMIKKSNTELRDSNSGKTSTKSYKDVYFSRLADNRHKIGNSSLRNSAVFSM